MSNRTVYLFENRKLLFQPTLFVWDGDLSVLVLLPLSGVGEVLRLNVVGLDQAGGLGHCVLETSAVYDCDLSSHGASWAIQKLACHPVLNCPQ